MNAPLSKEAVAKIQAALNKGPVTSDAKQQKPKPRRKQDLYLNLVGGDRVAATALSAIVGIAKSREQKKTLLQRFGKGWIAMPRSEWAEACLLSEAQFKNRARPILEKKCGTFLDMRAMKLSPDGPKLLWVSIDLEAMAQAVTDWEIYDTHNASPPVGKSKAPYPYKNNA